MAKAGNVLRILKPTEIKSLAYQCTEEECGLVMIVHQGKETMKYASAFCPACETRGVSKHTEMTQFKDMFLYLERLTQSGVRFVIPNEEG